MEDPILATMNTSVTTERPCVEETSGSIRLCTVESLPALRTGFSEDLSKRKPRSEKGGELDTRRHSTTRNADKRKDRSKASGGSSLRIQSRVNLHVARYNWTTKKDPKN